MLSEKIRVLVEEWAKYDFTYNAYGPQIPDKILYNPDMIREDNKYGLKGKTLAEYKQNGFITECIYNDVTKKTSAEKDSNPVIFTKIFRDLRDKNELMPSNFVYHVVRTLDAYNKDGKYDMDYYAKTVCRGLRSFASFIREIDLQEVLHEFLTTISRVRKVQYCLLDSTANDDVEGKADVLFRFDNQTVRVWSYQVTKPGIERTSNRIVDFDGNPRLSPEKNNGFNILMPFDYYKKKDDCFGWFLYDKNEVRHNLISLLINPQPVPYDSFYKEVAKDRNKVKTPAIFQVA